MKKSFIFLIIFTINILSLWAQDRFTFKGTIYDDEYAPLCGVRISSSETNVFAITDSDGKFEMECSRGEKIAFSYHGYKNFEWKVNTHAKEFFSTNVYHKPRISDCIVYSYDLYSEFAIEPDSEEDFKRKIFSKK